MNLLKYLLVVGIICFTVSCSKSSSDSDGNIPKAVDKTANLLATGDSANDILSNDVFDKLSIEIAYVKGFKPTESAITQFTDYLKDHTFKEDITLIYNELPSPVEDELTLQEIADLETKNRTVYTTDSTLAIYIYFADAPAEGDEPEDGLVTLGAVYRNTSMIIHEVTVRDLASRSITISESDVETTTLNHEFGHLFGLVDLGTDMVNDHQSQSENSDGQLVGDNHCNQNGCLMRAELQFGGATGKTNLAPNNTKYTNGLKAGCVFSGTSALSLLQNKSAKGSAVVGLDPECILDIKANGGR
ncbi:hypothetical protein [Maribacter hydrothermalis]|uniref:Membrane metalloprotease n=1 Tax=Maribacter hydrothermalis TaxID=1836467 RepID=A0A1B7ZCF5_9FLAO|nr:hypothetical protein [Maribacter hydrothermalis]APQ19332.1 hypothetical protein BTR34_11950 [Maribacter hydrothermalis]OBR40590.1 hypothetical protein A9200_15600 [Maribacter hydrothermalis]